MTRRKRRVLLGVLVAALALGTGLFVATAAADRRFYERHELSGPVKCSVHATEERDTYRRQAFTFDGADGAQVPALLALPLSGQGPWPAVVFLHGIGQSKSFLDRIAPVFTERGFALASFDQYTRGERKEDLGPVGEVRALRRRTAYTVIETSRLIDCLLTRDDIDPARVYLCGASFGAITGATAAAFDERIAAAVLCYGGGDLPLLMANEEARRYLGVFTKPLAHLAASLFRPADPVLHVGEIAPRPVLFQNGYHDRLIPAASARALQDAAGEPKTVIWYDSDHVGLDEDHTARVLDDAISWLEEQWTHAGVGVRRVLDDAVSRLEEQAATP